MGPRATASSKTLLRLFGQQRVRAVSFDVTGTLLVHRYPIMDTYAACALEARLCPDPPTAAQLKPAFKQAYKESCMASPCFGSASTGDRDWWKSTVRRAVGLAGASTYSERDFERFFRRVYQHYGSLEGYAVLDDTDPALSFLSQYGVVLGITSNTPHRTIETVLPMLGLARRFSFAVCCQDVGAEKPSPAIFQESFEQAKFALGDDSLKREEVLHIGDSLAADFCGARAFGMSALFLDRSGDSRVSVYQDWLTAPVDYAGKTQDDVQRHTITSLSQLREVLSPQQQ